MTKEQREAILAFNKRRKLEGDMAADFRKLLDLIPPSILKLLAKDAERAKILAKYLEGLTHGE